MCYNLVTLLKKKERKRLKPLHIGCLGRAARRRQTFGLWAAERSGIMEEKQLMYKSVPLYRKGNVLYYGDPGKDYIVKLQIEDTKKVSDMDVASKVEVSLQLTDPNIKHRDRIIKRTTRGGLYEAMDIAGIWLKRALAGQI